MPEQLRPETIANAITHRRRHTVEAWRPSPGQDDRDDPGGCEEQ
jgi:hypothetical protein